MTKRRLIFYALGFAFSVLPVALCVLLYFPLWVEQGAGAVLSGFTLLLLALAALPVLRYCKERGKTPGAPVFWGVLFLLFLSLSRIAHEMTAVSFWGCIGNTVGEIFFRFGRKTGVVHREGI